MRNFFFLVAQIYIGVDYTLNFPTSLTFEPGQTVIPLPILITDDVIAEEDMEGFTLTISYPAGDLMETESASVEILDNECELICFIYRALLIF